LEFRNLETMSPRLYGEMRTVITIGDRVVGNVFSPSFFLFLGLVFQNDLCTEKKKKNLKKPIIFLSQMKSMDRVLCLPNLFLTNGALYSI